MTENMKAFVEQVEKDAALKAELEAMSKEYGEDREKVLSAKEEIAQKTIAIAAKHGFTLTQEDFNQNVQELTHDQLDAVTGGNLGCQCGCLLYGEGYGFDDKAGRCVCFGGGYGGSDDGGGSATFRCVCVAYGAGKD